MFLLYHSDGCNTSEMVFHWCYVNDLHTTHVVVCWVTTEMVMETDGDSSGGTSPSRQGAGTETSISWNSSVAAAELQNSSGNSADCFRVFHQEASYRRRGVVRRRPGWPHNRWARPGAGPRPPVVWAAPSPSPALVWSSSLVWEK
jgi:hypothetical protein